MIRCDLHFGDPTAHATVEWFLRCLTEEESRPSEEFCKKLNVARFIDCLCQRVQESGIWVCLDRKARILTDGKWESCPHFSILLFSMARDALMDLHERNPQFAKNTSLYRVAEEIYECFKRRPDSYESCCHVFKTGFQLAYFEDDMSWHREYAAFKDRHYKELRELRLHYHSADNPATFARRAVERLKRSGSIAQEFNKLETKFQDLNPLRLELPIQTGSVEASIFANGFVQDLKSGHSDNRRLAEKFRIVQWEVQVRNLVEEEMRGRVCFHPITVNSEITGSPKLKEFLIPFISKAREIERTFFPSYGEVPTKKPDDGYLTEELFLDSVVQCHKSFKILMPEIPERYPSVHEDFARSFANMRASGNSPHTSFNAMLIEDGELSFFSLLWLLRYAVSKGKHPRVWTLNPNEKLPVRFRLNEGNGSQVEWSKCNMSRFAEECGWIIPLSDKDCLPTRRWKSLIAWLRRLNANLRDTCEIDKNHLEEKKELSHDDPLLQRLPVKPLDYDEEKTSFIKKLWEFFASDLANMLSDIDKHDSTTLEEFATRQLGRLVNSLDSFLEVESSAGSEDSALLGCSRGFIPLEHLFRTYQPYEMHLLIQALNWGKSPLEGWENDAPISLGFATIVGRVETSQDLMGESEISHFDHWIAPYRTLFSVFSTDVSLPVENLGSLHSSCELHLGDPTAHATVEWFLSQLPKVYRSTRNPHYQDEGFDGLCRDLNAVHFIDCLRQQVGKKKYDNEHFKYIERIANTPTQYPAKHPNLSILLLSIARKPLQSQNKESPLLDVVENIYYHFMKQSTNCTSNSKCNLCNSRTEYGNKPDAPIQDVKLPFCESRFLVFRAGCQLLHFRDFHDDRWKSQFAAFKRKHSEEISKFRLLYYSTDNIAVFTHRVIERWKRNNERIAEEFKYLEKNSDSKNKQSNDLNPLLFELPIKARSAEAFKFANRFVRDFEDPQKDKKEIGKDFAKDLAERFRIVQWEILVRNLVEEAIKDRVCFHPISVEHKIPGTPDKGYLNAFINNARVVECRFEPSDREIPTGQRYHKDNFPKGEIILDKNIAQKITKCRESFDMLLREIPNSYSFVHEDLVNSFTNMRASNKSSNTMLIEDGELSFFSLLWLLRYAVSEGDQPKAWTSNPEEELTVRFRLSEDNPSEAKWSKCNMRQFAEECGFIIPLPHSKCVPTRRWSSLITLLRRLNDDLGGTYTEENELQNVEQNEEKLNKANYLLKTLQLRERLRIKILYYDPNRISFIEKLWKFLASDRLKNMLDTLDESLSGTSMPYEKFAREFGCLVASLDEDELSLLKTEPPAGLNDIVLLRCSRGFVPLEHLIRTYNPCELHLLFQALNWEESLLGHKRPAPISIGCATIAGRVETDSTGDFESSETTVTGFDRWIDPYRSLFSVLNANFSLPAVQQDSEQIGIKTGIQTGRKDQKTYFAHQTAGLLDTIWGDSNKKALKSEALFALWLARIHATEIWGGFPIDTEEEIYEKEFPDWAPLSKKEIVTELVNLGLQGGIKRAGKSEIEELQEYAWDLDEILRGDEIKFRCAISKSLSFDPDSPNTPPPDYMSLSFNIDSPNTSMPRWVTTKVFAICFFHGMRQAVYHALKASCLSNFRVEHAHLWLDWDGQRVAIYNKGEVNKEHHGQRVSSTDREFFDDFERKIDNKFKIVGPKPFDATDDTWQFVIIKR